MSGDRCQNSYFWVGYLDWQGTKEKLLEVLTMFSSLIWEVVIHLYRAMLIGVVIHASV